MTSISRSPNRSSYLHDISATVPYNFAPPPDWGTVIAQHINLESQREIPRTMDLGCGPGQFLEALSALAPGCVLGVDLSTAMLKQANENVGAKFPLLQADANSLPFSAAFFDLILVRYLLHHLENPLRVVSEAARCLKRGGYIVVETSDPEWLMTQPVYLQFPSIGVPDLRRWPTIRQVADWMAACSIRFQSSSQIHLLRDEVPKKQYLERLRLWQRDGGGTSFRRQFDEEQRQQFVHERARELAREDDAYCVPIFTDSVVLVGERV